MTNNDDNNETKTTVSANTLGDFFWEVVSGRKSDAFVDAYHDAERQSGWQGDTVDGMGQDIFQSLFQLDPKLKEKMPKSLEARRRVMEEALTSPEMEDLRRKTRLNQSTTMMAWSSLFPSLLKRLREIMDEPSQGGDGDGDDSDEDGDGDGGGGGGSDGDGDDQDDDDQDGDGGGDGDGDGDQDDDDDQDGDGDGGDGDGDDDQDDDEDGDGDGDDDQDGDGNDDIPDLSSQQLEDIRQAIGEACEDAEEQVEAFQKAWGSDKKAFNNLPLEEQLRLAERVSNDPQFAEIMELAGNIERITFSNKAKRMTDVPEEIVDVEFGNDIHRMTASERLRICDPDGEIDPQFALMAKDWEMRYIEHKLELWRMEGSEEINKGPIVVCVDCSGSMSGHSNVMAKGLTVGICKLAAKEKRPVRVVLFSCSVETYDSPDYNNDLEYLRFIENVATRFSGGGTDFNAALEEAMPAFETEGDYSEADLIFITDGAAGIRDDVMEKVTESKEEYKWHLYNIYIGTYGCDALDAISDETWNVSSLNNEICLELTDKLV